MDIDQLLHSVVAIRASIPDDAFTARTLGTLREGSGVVIRDNGLVLTIGYLITEADEIWLTTKDGRVVPGHALAIDQTSGFGLVQALGRLDLPALKFGDSAKARRGDPVTIADGGGQVVAANIVSTQEFAGYWEYLLEEAILTAPAHPSWGGAALIDSQGKLLGIGSLRLETSGTGGGDEDEDNFDINMVVPINLLPPILDDLLSRGHADERSRPWLGVFSADSDGKVVVVSLAETGPAAAAGLREGDIITDVRDEAVADLADFYRKVWSSGPAGTEIPIRIVRNGRDAWMRVKSADRRSFLKKPRLQ